MSATRWENGSAGGRRIRAVAAAARQRASEAGVADRVEIRCADALATPDTTCFDSAFSAQQFFPAATRPAMYAALRRVLKPGGLLLLPGYVPGEPPTSVAELRDLRGRFYAALRLQFGRWDVPALPLDALEAEAQDAGFTPLRRTWSGRNWWLLFRAPGQPVV